MPEALRFGRLFFSIGIMDREVDKGTRRRGIYLLPNLLTTGGLFAGFFSIVAATDGNFVKAAVAIIVAMFLDGLDGRVARMTSTESDFGKEYDSLADMVSFGLAPSIVTYQWGVARLSEYGAAWHQVGWLGAFLFTVAAAFRLARFNTHTVKDNRFFEGLPSPSAAGGIASMVWLSTAYEIAGLTALAGGIMITVIAAVLMMSRFRYYSFKDLNLGTTRVRFQNLFIIPLVLVFISINPPVVCFGMFIVYASHGPIIWLWKRRRRVRSGEGAV